MTPANQSYTLPSGRSLYVGKAAPGPSLPAWVAAATLNNFFAIPGTTGAGGASVDAFSGWCDCDNGLFVIDSAGGHHDSADNRVVSIRLTDDAPSWVLRHASSTTTPEDVNYYPDGLPASRHTYSMHQWSSALNRVLMLGCRFAWGNAFGFLTTDGFNLDTNSHDAAGTWPNVPTMDGGSVKDGAGNFWVYGATKKGTVSGGTITWTSPLTSEAPNRVRYPWARNTDTGELFGLCWADGEGFGTGQVNAVAQIGNVQRQITFNASAALTQFIADAPTSSGMDYDRVNGWFGFYCGQGAGAGRLYKITPNAGTVWDIAIHSTTGTPAATYAAGIMNKFSYVPALRGFAFLPSKTGAVHFIKTAA